MDLLAAIAARISARLDELGISERRASLEAGLGVDTIRDIRRGRAPRPEVLVQLSQRLGCTIDWLITGTEPSQLASQPAAIGRLSEGLIEIDNTEFAAVPRFDARLSAGPGSIVPDHPEPEGYQLFERQWLRAITATRPSQLALLRVDGESMEDTLSDGDWVLVDRDQTNPAREGIYALHVDDVAWVKRLSVNKPMQTIRILSDNPRWPPQEWPADEVRVLGRVVWIVGRKVV